MRCPACDAENPDATANCASCGASLTPEPVPEPSAAAAPPGRRLSKLAVFALLAAAIAPWMQVLTIASGGGLLDRFRAQMGLLLMTLDIGATVLFVAAIAASMLALAGVLTRRVRGGALAIGALLMALGGLRGSSFLVDLSGKLGEMAARMAGNQGRFVWQLPVIIAAAAIVCEIVLALPGRRAVATETPAEEAPAEAAPAAATDDPQQP